MKKSSTKPALTKLFLVALVASGKTAIDLATFIQDLHLYRSALLKGGWGYVAELKRLEKLSATKLLVKRLRRRHYVTAKKLGDRLIVTLTDKGSMAVLTHTLRLTRPRDDGRYTVVVFDIPLSQNTARRQFRWLLRQGNFVKLQQSVWVSRGDTYDIIARLVRQLKLTPWVNIFRADSFLHLPKSSKS